MRGLRSLNHPTLGRQPSTKSNTTPVKSNKESYNFNHVSLADFLHLINSLFRCRAQEKTEILRLKEVLGHASNELNGESHSVTVV